MSENSGYVFYSDVKLMGILPVGSMLICEACTQRIISTESFAAPRKHTGSFSDPDMLNELNAESIIARCKTFGLSPERAKQKARELALEVQKNKERGQDIAYAFWTSR
jgi:hypothetical protein